MKKALKWFAIILVSIFLAGELFLLVSGNWYVNRVLAMTIFSGRSGPDIDDLDLFPKRKVNNGTPQPWPLSADIGKNTLPDKTLIKINGYETVSFLVIREDSIVYEMNNDGYGYESYVNSFSMAKSINALLIGCAIRDGLIGSVNEPVSDYIEQFREGAKSKILIRHLLTMSSGLDFHEEYVSPFAWPAEAYYGPDVNELTLRSNSTMEPGKYWIYKGGDSQLLGMILKKVLKGKDIADYASEKIWKPVGAEHPAYWGIDSKGMEKVSCCWYTNARDYARIAKLMMQQGNWNGVQLIDSSFIKDAIAPAELLEPGEKPSRQYGYQWWLMKYKGHEIYYMRGIRGQYVFAIPDENMIAVRLGHRRDSHKTNDLPDDIFVYLDAALSL